MLQLKNHTPFEAQLSLLNNEFGQETLFAIIKATFSGQGQWTLAQEQVPVWQEDEYHQEPGTSSLRYPSECHLGKLATDILVEGEACAPEARAVRQLPVSVAVADRRKELSVFGDRVWLGDRVSAPEPFVRMPLLFERAYGGTLEREGETLACDERNPVGRFVAAQYAQERRDGLDGEPLPNIEEPTALIRALGDRPPPVGLGPLAPHWAGRAQYAGTYDQDWQVNRAPYAPDDFSRRYFNSAAPGMVYPGWLQGGEPVCVKGMHPEGDWAFNLPRVSLSVRANVNGSEQALEPQLETLLLQPGQRQLVMSWRAQLACPKQALQVQSVSVAMRR